MMKFRQGNRWKYGQDHHFWTGVPDGIDFHVEPLREGMYRLRACGYGCLQRHSDKCYGNGALYLLGVHGRMAKRVEQAILNQNERCRGK